MRAIMLFRSRAYSSYVAHHAWRGWGMHFAEDDLDRFKSRFRVTLLAVLVCWAGPSMARVIHVNASAGEIGDGSSWASVYRDLQSALSAAQSGDEIWVTAGTLKPSVEVGGTGHRYRAFQLKNGIAIYGGFAGTEISCNQRDWQVNETVLSGDLEDNDNDNLDVNEPTRQDNCYHVFFHPEGTKLNETAILDGVTVTGGNANDEWRDGHSSGGGMYNCGSHPMVTNCVFRANTAKKFGIGMHNLQSAPKITNCVFKDNASIDDEAGAMTNHSMDESTSPVVINSIFRDNLCVGMDNASSHPMVINCAFYANLGSGMRNWESDATVINCTFVGNSTDRYGGGMYNHSADPIVTNCIFWANSGLGSQIYSDGISNPTMTYSDIQHGYPGIGNFSADPMFADMASGDLRLETGSPCIDSGNNVAIPQSSITDITGGPRICCERVDMGAYEHCETLKVSDPVFIPDGGALATNNEVTIICYSPGVEIRCTTDGREPTQDDLKVQSGGRPVSYTHLRAHET